MNTVILANTILIALFVYALIAVIVITILLVDEYIDRIFVAYHKQTPYKLGVLIGILWLPLVVGWRVGWFNRYPFVANTQRK